MSRKFQIDYEIRSSACVEGIDEHDALRRFKQQNSLADVLHVAAFDSDGKDVIGVCEGCNRHIIAGDVYSASEDLIYLCGDCKE